ncbi:DMT family transporter [Acidaminococcus timonensis]|jgi:drug/metabolite transporter (DMT)-like permease|uniref:DMT family transporter n=1 Tax=Acidaminococcus timonensis TaxID=1871002 RepID=UPI003A5C4626
MQKSWQSPLLCTLVIVIWGSLYISGRLVLQYIPALLVLFIRYALSSVILLGVGYHTLHGHIAIARKDWGELFFVGLVGYYLSNAALFLGIQYSSASFASLINSLTPVVISGLAIALLGEKVTKLQMGSLLVAVLGAAIIIGKPTAGVTTAGMVISVFALFSWAYATIHLKKLTAKYDPLLVTGYGMAIAAVLSLPTAWAFIRVTGAPVSFAGGLWAPLLYTSLVCTAFAHLMWNELLQKLPATYCASFYPLQPLTSMLLGVLLLGEEMTLSLLIGAACIVSAMVLNTLAARKA